MNIKDLLRDLCAANSVSGSEKNINDKIQSIFSKYADKISVDSLGNVIILKKGENNYSKLKIMVASHLDEIGLMVKSIEENGFIKFTNIGGIDSRTLLGQEITIHGKKDLFGVIISKPPHLQDESESNKVMEMDELYIDLGYSYEKVKEYVNIGDVITINRELIELNGNRVACKSLDDKAGIASLYECIKELNKMKHEADVYFVCTVQEEEGMRGAYTSAYGINPDIGIAVDVGFGATPEISRKNTIVLGHGPGITIGGNIHPKLRKEIINIAKEYNVPYQHEVFPESTGTDASAIQITRQGIPTLCLSIPLRYMHTSVEVVDMKDIKNTGKLLAYFISLISNDNLEGLLCY